MEENKVNPEPAPAAEKKAEPKKPYVRISFVDPETKETLTDRIIDAEEWKGYQSLAYNGLKAHIQKAPARRKLKNAQLRVQRARENEEKLKEQLRG